MPPIQLRPQYRRLLLLSASSFILCSFFCCDAQAAPSPAHERRNNNPLNIDWAPAPPPDKGPPLSAGALRDPAYLPAQIGGIVGSYALSLVLVAVLLLFLSKKRREHLSAADNEVDFEERKPQPQISFAQPASPRSIPRSPVRNFSYPSPDQAEFPAQYVYPSPASTLHAPGIDFSVDQRIVAADREMAQSQLEEMYKYVMEQEEAKAQGIVLDAPPLTGGSQRPSTSDKSTSTLSKKEKNKPAHLNLGREPEKTQSRASSILSALRSPRKKGVRGISISSPIMTPMSGTFPRHESQEMNTIPPRQYAPPPPPPVPEHQLPYGVQRNHGQVSPVSPDHSPESTKSIDERIGNQLPPSRGGHSRNTSAAPTEHEPVSAISEHSQAPLIGLPTSPKPGVNRFPTLPASPKPGATFQSLNATTAVRTGGALPLRAYEPALTSPSFQPQTTKQTVFERMGPLSPMSGAGTPYTGAAVPYSPYQPFSPCIPMTPSLVTRADRKRMKRLEPKTPTMEMVRSAEDIW